jgi:hypothetical protein
MKPDDQLWKRLARNLASVRRKKALLMWLGLILFFTIFALLYSARVVANRTLEIPWGLYLLVVLCLGLLFSLRIFYDRS